MHISPSGPARAALVLWLLGAAALAGAAAPQDRHAAWTEDLDVVRERFLRLDRSYPEAAREAAERRLAVLRTQVDRLDDVEIAAELARIAALSGNAHTRAYLLRNRGHWRRYPLRMWRFADGWRVVAAHGEAEALLGGRVTHVAGRPVDAVARELRPLFAGNDSWADYMGSYTLTSADALQAIGAVGPDGRVEFRIEDMGAGATGGRSLVVAPMPFERRETVEESWWFLSPGRPVDARWRHAIASVASPESLRGVAADYRFARCADDALYVQFSRAFDTPGQETVAAWGERLLQELRRRPPRHLVFDLRFNTGGDLNKARALIDALADSELGRERARLFVLSGTSTFSAGITALAALRDKSRAIVVGRPPGDGTDFWSEGGNVVLPHSRLVMHYADGLHSYSGRARAAGLPEHIALGLAVSSLAPDVPVPWTWSDYAAGRDPDVETALGGPLRCDVDPAPAGR